jgi:hypothetical protein
VRNFASLLSVAKPAAHAMNKLKLVSILALGLGLAARDALGFASHAVRCRKCMPSNYPQRVSVRYYQPPENYNDDAPPFSDAETPRDRARRMSLARELQSLFYKEEVPHQQPAAQTNTKLPYGSTVLRNLPTLTTHDRIKSADVSSLLPGYQYVWHIHSPQHCHMFHSILSGPAPWYIGHVFLPGSTPSKLKPSEDEVEISIIDSMESYSDVQNRLRSGSPLYGTLIRITDRRFQDDDGSIVLAVQSIDRIRVHSVASVPGTYLSTDVQLSPEVELMNSYFDRALMSSATYISSHGNAANIDENSDALTCPSAVSGAARAAAAADSSRVRRFEYLPIFLEEKPTRPRSPKILQSSSSESNVKKLIKNAIREQDEMKKENGPEYISVVQLCNYDAFEYSSLGNADSVTSQALKTYWQHLAKEKSQNAISEGDLFDAHGGSSSKIPFVLPEPAASTYSSRPVSVDAVQIMERHVWCSLDEMIRLLSIAAASTVVVPIPSQLLGLLPIRNDWPRGFALEDYAKSLAKPGSAIGTAFKSPFVRVDEISSSNSSSYSHLRRAQRLSYSIWLLLDGLAMTGAQPPPPPRNVILAMDIEERLNAAKQTLDGINSILRKIIPENRKDGDDN